MTNKRLQENMKLEMQMAEELARIGAEDQEYSFTQCVTLNDFLAWQKATGEFSSAYVFMNDQAIDLTITPGARWEILWPDGMITAHLEIPLCANAKMGNRARKRVRFVPGKMP